MIVRYNLAERVFAQFEWEHQCFECRQNTARTYLIRIQAARWHQQGKKEGWKGLLITLLFTNKTILDAGFALVVRNMMFWSACGVWAVQNHIWFRATKFSPKSFWATNFRDTPHPYPPHWISGYMFFLRNLVARTPMFIHGTRFCNRYSSNSFHPIVLPFGFLYHSEVFSAPKKIQKQKINFGLFSNQESDPSGSEN